MLDFMLSLMLLGAPPSPSAGVVVERPAVAAAAEWFVYDYLELVAALQRYKVAMVGGTGLMCCVSCAPRGGYPSG
jgi:hypothetical protein